MFGDNVMQKMNKALARFMAFVMILSVVFPAELQSSVNLENIRSLFSTDTVVYAGEVYGSIGTIVGGGGHSTGVGGITGGAGISVYYMSGDEFEINKDKPLESQKAIMGEKGFAYDASTFVAFGPKSNSYLAYYSSNAMNFSNNKQIIKGVDNTSGADTNEYSISKEGSYWTGGGVYFKDILNALITDPGEFKSSGYKNLLGKHSEKSLENMSFIGSIIQSGNTKYSKLTIRLKNAFSNDLEDENSANHLGYDQLVGNKELPEWVVSYAESVGVTPEEAAIAINKARFLDALYQARDIFNGDKQLYVNKIVNVVNDDLEGDKAVALGFSSLVQMQDLDLGACLLLRTTDYLEYILKLDNANRVGTDTLLSNYKSAGKNLAGNFYHILGWGYKKDLAEYPNGKKRISVHYDGTNPWSHASSAITSYRLSSGNRISGDAYLLDDSSSKMTYHEMMSLNGDPKTGTKAMHQYVGAPNGAKTQKYWGLSSLPQHELYGYNALVYIQPNLAPVNYFGHLEAEPDDYPLSGVNISPNANVDITPGIYDAEARTAWIDFLNQNKEKTFTYTVKEITRVCDYNEIGDAAPDFGGTQFPLVKTFTGAELIDVITNDTVIFPLIDTSVSTYRVNSTELATGMDLRIQFDYTMDCELTWEDTTKPDGKAVALPKSEEDKTDDASYIYTKQPRFIYRTYTSTPEAFAELKNYNDNSDWSSGKLNESWEVMSGVPTTEQLYFAAGGSEFIIDITLGYTEETAVRSYVSHINGDIECEFYIKDAIYDGNNIDMPSCGKVTIPGDYVCPSFDRARGSGGMSQWTDRNVQCLHEAGGDWTIVYEIDGDSHCGAESGEETWHMCGICGGVRIEDSHTYLERDDYNNGNEAMDTLRDQIDGTIVFWTSTSEGNEWHTNTTEQGIYREMQYRTSKSTSYDSGDHTSRGNDGVAGCGGAHDKCGSCCSGHTAGSGSTAYTYTDGCGNACVGAPCTAGSKCSGSHYWHLTLTCTLPAHGVCGPCCSHWLPDIYDTWSQTFTYDTFKIIDTHLWQIDQAAASGLEEVIGPAVDIDGTEKGSITIDYEVLGQYSQEKRGGDILGAYVNPHGLADGIVGAKITTNHPTVFYNIAFKNSQDLPGNSMDVNYNTQDSAWGKATEHSLTGRLRYNVTGAGTGTGGGAWADAAQHDEVYYELDERTNHCDGLSKTYPTNVEQAGGGGHGEQWGDGFIYDAFKGSPTTTGTSDNSGFAGQMDFPRNDKNFLQEHVDGIHADYAAFMARGGVTLTPSETNVNLDVNTDEYKWLAQKRVQPITVTMLTDWMILQTTHGDQSVMYFQKESEDNTLFDVNSGAYYDRTVRIIEDTEGEGVVPEDADYDEPKVTIEANENIPQGSRSLITTEVTVEDRIPSLWITPYEMWEQNGDSASSWSAYEINIGGYNGNPRSPGRKFDVASTGTTKTLFDNGDPAEGSGNVIRNGQEQNYAGFWNERVQGSDPHCYIQRDERPTKRLMINSLPLNIITARANNDYLTSGLESEVFYSNNIHWSDIGSYDGAKAKAYGKNPSFKSRGAAQYDRDETIKDVVNFNFGWLQDVVTVWGQENYDEENSYMGHIIDTKYNEAGPDSEELNGLVIHDPISSDYTSLISLPPERDQRYATVISSDTMNNQNNSEVCPGTVEECEFALVDCKYSIDSVVALMSFSGPSEDSILNEANNVQLALPAGWTQRNGKLHASTASAARMAIALAYGSDSSGLGVTYSGTTRVRVDADVSMTDFTGKKDTRVSQMIFSYNGLALYVSNTGKIGFMTQSGQYRESTTVTLAPNTTYSISAVISMKSLDDCSVEVNGSPVTLFSSSVSEVPLNGDIVGKYFNIGAWGYDNSSSFRGSIDNLAITRLAGNLNHSDDCYTTVEVHPSGLNAHVHTVDCLDAQLENPKNTVWQFNYTGGVQSFTAPDTGTYTLYAWGASGGDARYMNSNTIVKDSGGAGGFAHGEVQLKAGQTIYIYVGGRGQDQTSTKKFTDNFKFSNAGGLYYTDALGGYNGGGNGGVDINLDSYNGTYPESGAGGGGMSHITFSATDALGNKTTGDYTKEQTYSFDAEKVILAAAGGGGAGSHYGDGYVVATPYNNVGSPTLTSGATVNGNAWNVTGSGQIHFYTSLGGLSDARNGMVYYITVDGTNSGNFTLDNAFHNGTKWDWNDKMFSAVKKTTNGTKTTYTVEVLTDFPLVDMCLKHSGSASNITSVTIESRFNEQVQDESAGGVAGGSTGETTNDYTKGGSQIKGYRYGLGSNGLTAGTYANNMTLLGSYDIQDLTIKNSTFTTPKTGMTAGIYKAVITGTGLQSSTIELINGSTKLDRYILSSTVSDTKVEIYFKPNSSSAMSNGMYASIVNGNGTVNGYEIYRIDGYNLDLVGEYTTKDINLGTCQPGEYLAVYVGNNLGNLTPKAYSTVDNREFFSELVRYSNNYIENHIVVANDNFEKCGLKLSSTGSGDVQKVYLYRLKSDENNAGATGGAGGGYFGGTHTADVKTKTDSVAYGGAGGSSYIGGCLNGTMIAGDSEMPKWTATLDSDDTMVGNRGNGFVKIVHTNTYYDDLRATYEPGGIDPQEEAELRKIFGDAYDALFINEDLTVNSGNWAAFGNGAVKDAVGNPITSAYNSTLEVNAGKLIQYITGTSPYFTYDITDLKAVETAKIMVNVVNKTAGNKAKIFWITNKDTTWNNAKSIDTTILTAEESKENGVVQNQVVNFAVSANANWKDTITQIRIAIPSNADKNYDSTVEIGTISGTAAVIIPDNKNYDYTGGRQTYTAPLTGYYLLQSWGAQGGGTTLGQVGDTLNFAYTGGIQQTTLNPGKYKLEVWGGAGGKSSHGDRGGYGGYSSGIYTVTVPTTVYVVVGEAGGSIIGGYNGGGNGSTTNNDSAAGGGATHIATKSGVLSSLSNNKSSVIIVAGGGGASGCSNTTGGGGGGTTGTAAVDPHTGFGGPGGPGTQTAGGAGGTNSGSGSFGQGGHTGTSQAWPGGGGGGGYYGGGAGGNMSGGGGAGGGGSGYTTGLESATMTSDTNSGNGKARITTVETFDGDNETGGRGGYTTAVVRLARGETISVYVGGEGKASSAMNTGGGYNGGGHGHTNGYGGGGMTHFSTSTSDGLTMTSTPYQATETVYTNHPKGTMDGNTSYPGKTSGSSWSDSSNTNWTSVKRFTVASSGTVTFWSDSPAATSRDIDPVARLIVNGSVAVTNDDGGEGYNFSISYNVNKGDIISYEISSYREAGATVHWNLTHPGLQTSTTQTVTRYNEVVTGGFNVGALISVAGGGGGSAVAKSAGHGGGTAGGNVMNNGTAISGTASGQVTGNGLGGSQTGGFKQGIGEYTKTAGYSGAGGGYWGGTVYNGNYKGGSGGSGYVKTGAGVEATYKVDGKTYVSQTYGGNTTIPNNPRNIAGGGGTTTVGNYGDGYAVVSFLRYDNFEFPTLDEVKAQLDKLPENSPLFGCEEEPNIHVCDNKCGLESVLQCTEPHHTGGHYVGSPLCYTPCNNDQNHKKKDVDAVDPTFTPGNFVNIDWGFEIFFPNVGDFAGNNAHGLSQVTGNRGMGFENQMWTDIWTKKKTIVFDFNAIYAGNLYRAGNEIPIADKGDYTGVDGSPYNEQNWSLFGNWMYNSIYGAAIFGWENVPIVQPGEHMSRMGGSTYVYPFYVPLANNEIRSAECNVRTYAINNFDGGEEIDDSGSGGAAPSNLTNRNRNANGLESNHTTFKAFWFDVVGRVGSLALLDTGDYKFSNLFKQSTQNAIVDPNSTMATLANGGVKAGINATENESGVVASVAGSYGYAKPSFGDGGLPKGHYKMTINGAGLLSSRLEVLVTSSWNALETLSTGNGVTIIEKELDSGTTEVNPTTKEDPYNLLAGEEGVGAKSIVGRLESKLFNLEAGKYQIVTTGQSFLNAGPEQPDFVNGPGQEFVKDGKFIVSYTDEEGVKHYIETTHNYSTDEKNTMEFELTEDIENVQFECHYYSDVFLMDSMQINKLNTSSAKDLVKDGAVSTISLANTFGEYYVTIAEKTPVEIRVYSKGREIELHSVKIEELGEYSDSWIVDGIISEVDIGSQREYLVGDFDVRGLEMANTGSAPDDDGRGAMLSWSNGFSLYTNKEMERYTVWELSHATVGETIDTYNSMPWASSARALVNLPLTPKMNNIDILKDEPMTMGYGLYLSVQTIGNYNARDIAYLQVIPEYYLLDTETGEFFPADIYLQYNQGYYPVNIWGLMTNEDIYTWGSEGSGYDVNSIYNYTINLDWLAENTRRMVSTIEQYKTSKIIEDKNRPQSEYRVPGGHAYIQGNAQFLQLDGRARTFIGDEYVNIGIGLGEAYSRYDASGVITKGELVNYGPGNPYVIGAGAANRKIVTDAVTNITSNQIGVLDAYDWWYRAQRWHFTVALPSSAVAIRAGEQASTDTIAEYWSKDSKYVLVSTIDIRALGEVWNLRYGQYGNNFKVVNNDIEFNTKGSFQIPTKIKLKGHDHYIPQAIAVYGPNPIEFEYAIISLH